MNVWHAVKRRTNGGKKAQVFSYIEWSRGRSPLISLTFPPHDIIASKETANSQVNPFPALKLLPS